MIIFFEKFRGVMDIKDLIKVQMSNCSNVEGLYTTRNGGVSSSPFDTANMGYHVNDKEADVKRNRELLASFLPKGTTISWMNQIHSTKVIEVNASNLGETFEADAQITKLCNVALAVMTADCLPILLSSIDGAVIGVVHCGWKGLQAGILEKTIKLIGVDNKNISAWLGPCIGKESFEVGVDVYNKFVEFDKELTKFFNPKKEVENKYLADLSGIAEHKLRNLGVVNIENTRLCTYSDEKRFFSYRRENKTGRMVGLIWKK